MEQDQAGGHWKRLNDVWKIANQDARISRHEVTKAFGDCAAGRGAGPSEALINEAARLERIADNAKLEEDSFLHKHFGI